MPINMTEKAGGLYAPKGSRSVVAIQDGSQWLEIPGIKNISVSPGSRSADTIEAFRGVMSVLGSQSIETITFTIQAYQPYQHTLQLISQAYEDNAEVTFYLVSPAAKKYDTGSESNDPKIGVTPTTTASDRGGLSFTNATALQKQFAGNKYQIGHAIRIGNVNYYIESINVENGALTPFVATNPGSGGVWVRRADKAKIAAAVTATNATTYDPGLHVSFAAGIESKPDWNIGSSATEVSQGTLTVRPSAPIPDPELWCVAGDLL